MRKRWSAGGLLPGGPLLILQPGMAGTRVMQAGKGWDMIEAVPLTEPPGSHWFGYCDKWQFDRSGTRIPGQGSSLDLRMPKAGD